MVRGYPYKDAVWTVDGAQLTRSITIGLAPRGHTLADSFQSRSTESFRAPLWTCARQITGTTLFVAGISDTLDQSRRMTKTGRCCKLRVTSQMDHIGKLPIPKIATER